MSRSPFSEPTPAARLSLTDRIHSDHEALEGSMGSLEGLLCPCEEDGADFIPWKLHVLHRLRRFQADLLRHFDLEETTNYGGDLLLHAPHYAHRVDQLEEEHIKIANDLEHIISMTKRVQSVNAPILKRLDHRLCGVLDCLKRHEEDERELLQNTYNQELGVGD
jgi:hypothetical protein